MSRVDVSPEVLRWARERAGLTSEELTRKVHARYEEWERGEAQPTLRQLEALAKKTTTPLGQFFLPSPPEEKLPIPDFRTVQGTPVRRPSPNLLDTVELMQRRQDWMREFLIEEGEPPVEFLSSVRLSDPPQEVAAAIRNTLGVSEEWARHQETWSNALRALREVIEEAGVLVVINSVVGNNPHRRLDPDEFRGFILCDEYAPLIFVNGADAKAGELFTLAHELAHLWLGQGGVFNLRDMQPAENEVEKFCNHVAAELLVPAQTLREHWSTAESKEEPFQFLAGRFKVSPLVAARRALDLGLINRETFFGFYHEYLEDERRKRRQRDQGGDFYANLNLRVGRRFAHAVIRAAKEGRLLYREAYQLTGLHGKTFDQYARELGFRVR